VSPSPPTPPDTPEPPSPAGAGAPPPAPPPPLATTAVDTAGPAADAGWLGERGSPRRVVARNALWTWGVFLANGVALFVLARYLVQDLGDEAFGFWSFFLALTGYFGLADLGVRPAVVHFVARHDAQGDLAGLNRHVNAAFTVFAFGAAVLLLLTVGTALWVPHWDRLGSVSPDDAVAVVLIIGIEIAVTFPFNAFSAVLIGRQRFDTVAKIDLVILLLRTAVTIVLVESEYGLVALAWAYGIAGVVEIAWKSWAAFRELPGLRFAPRMADRAARRALLGYGGWAVVIAVALTLTWQTDPVVIGMMLSLAAVPHFTQPGSLAAQARALLWAACRVLAPAAGALEGRGNRAEVTRMLVHASRIMLLLAGPMLAYLVVLGDPFLDRWLGENYRGESGRVLTILALGVAAPIASQPLVQVLYGVNRLKPLALTYVLEGGANLVLSLLLAKPLGIVGVAIATAVPAFVVHAVLLPRLLARSWGLSWGRLTLSTWPLPLVAGAITWGALEVLTDRSAPYGWGALFGWALAALGIQAGVVALLLALERLLVVRGRAAAADEGVA
jgi:O-antigen/teichoic acid export membrane protein